MKTISKEELFKKFSTDFPCRVWYKNQKDYVEYASCKHVRWKAVVKITILFKESKKYYVGNGDYGSRDGACYLLKQ